MQAAPDRSIPKKNHSPSKARKKEAMRARSSSGFAPGRARRGKWEKLDTSRLLPELRELDEISSETSIRTLDLAAKHFRRAMRELDDADKKIELIRIDAAGRKYRYTWMKTEAVQRAKQRMEKTLYRARLRARSRLESAIRYLERIRNSSVRKSVKTTDLKSKVYIEYVKLQFILGNPGVCIPILKAYIKLRPEYEKEKEPHRLLAAAYARRARTANKMGNARGAAFFRKNKRVHLLRYAELKHGPKSNQYRKLKEQMRRSPDQPRP